MRLRIGHLSTFYHTSILLLAQGTRDNISGVDLEWNLFGTGPEIVCAFERKELDLAYIGLPPAIIGMARGVRVKCVAGGHIEGTVICGKNRFRTYPELPTLQAILNQFRGLRIGVPGNGSIHDVILKDSLDRSGLSAEIEIVNYKWADEIIDDFASGKLSGGFGTPALAIALDRYADGKILYPPQKLWPYNPSYGILADEDLLLDHRAVVESFLLLHENASFFIKKNPRKAASIISGYVGLVDEKFVLDVLAVSPKYCSQLTQEYINETLNFAIALRRLGFINKAVTAPEIFDTSLIGKIHPPGDHYQEGPGGNG